MNDFESCSTCRLIELQPLTSAVDRRKVCYEEHLYFAVR